MSPELYTFVITKNGITGTAFLINEKGLLATCFHTIENAFRTTGMPFGNDMEWRTLTGETGEAVIINNHDRRQDVALLKITSEFPAHLRPVKLIRSTAAIPNTKFSMRGYGLIRDKHISYDDVSAIGHIVGESTRNQVSVLQLQSAQLLEGLSGAPVYCEKLEGVVGLLSARFSIDPKSNTWLEHTGWAAKSEAIADLLPGQIELLEPPASSESSLFNLGRPASSRSVVLNIGNEN